MKVSRTVPRSSGIVQARRISLVVRNGYKPLHIMDVAYSIEEAHCAFDVSILTQST